MTKSTKYQEDTYINLYYSGKTRNFLDKNHKILEKCKFENHDNILETMIKLVSFQQDLANKMTLIQ